MPRTRPFVGLESVVAGSSGRVLIVAEDRPKQWEIVSALTGQGFETTHSVNLSEGFRPASPRLFDIVIIDLGSDRSDGLKLCCDLRTKSSIPIILLGNSSDVKELVEGFAAGADDYIRPPVDVRELLARVRALLRRGSVLSVEDVLRIGDLEIDTHAFAAYKAGHRISLSPTEFRLLYALASNEGSVMTRQTLFEAVWGHTYLGDSRLVDMAINRLRAKVEVDPSHPCLIRTIRGMGYVLKTHNRTT